MTDWNEHEDAIDDVISDSIDMDWTSRTGAKAVVAWLNENAPAPAPSSLAGGEVVTRLENDLRTRTRYREDDGFLRLKVREDDLRAILAALSPEAPAREGVEWHRLGVDLPEYGRPLLIAHKRDGEDFWRVRDAHLYRRYEGVFASLDHLKGGEFAKDWWFDSIYPGKGDLRLAHEDLLWSYMPEPDTGALTPRHEAPASHAFEASHSIQREGGCKVCGHDEASHEAPAEGAGEALKPYLSLINSTPDLLSLLYDADMLPEQTVTMRGAVSVAAVCEAYQAGLRARSSAPEAREEALGNLLAVIHGDGGHRALEVGTKQAALEAEKIVARLLSSAPEAREREVVAWLYETVSGTKTASVEPLSHINGDKVYGTALYTHPAAPSADKLRIAVETLEPFANLGVSSGPDDEPCHYAYRITRGAIRNARQALATLKAEV